MCLAPGSEDHALYTLIGHVTRDTRTYRYSADSYARAMRVRPECPFARLYLATIYTQIATQRFTTNRASASTQAVAFLSEYKKLRNPSVFGQEIHFNIGRVLQQLGLSTMALIEYRKVLDLEPTLPAQTSSQGRANGRDHIHDRRIYDLRPEAAYNMSLIYKQSGNFIIAKQIISKYCRI